MVLAEKDLNYGFSIIMYHHISSDKSKIGDFVITPQTFENDLKYLKEKGYKSITVRNLYDIAQGKKKLDSKSIMITFDDGQESFYKYAFPLLKKYGFSAVFSIIGKYTEQFSNIEDHNIEYSHVTWSQLVEMQREGIVEIGNHSYDMHYNSPNGRYGVGQIKGESAETYKNKLENDINQFNDLFEKNLGFKPTIFTYPYGNFSETTKNIIKENGFTAAFTCYGKKIVPTKNKDWLYNLGRYNRKGTESTKNFFKRINVF